MKFPQLKINQEILDINIPLFDDLFKIINGKTTKYVLLKDSYYNSFFDEEISLFWFFFKTYLAMKNFENNQCTNFDCLHILFNRNLTKLNKPHVLSMHHDVNIDFFTNLKKINPLFNQTLANYYQNPDASHHHFINYINNCGTLDYWRFLEKNLQKIVTNSINNDIHTNNDEKIFLAKDFYKYSEKNIDYNCFYYWYCDNKRINDDYFSFKEDFLKLLNKRLNILKTGCYHNDTKSNLLILIEVSNEEELEILQKFLSDSSIEKSLYKSIYKFLILYKGKKYDTHSLNYSIFNINSSLTFYDGDYETIELLLKNKSSSFLLSILKSETSINDNILKKQKYKEIRNLIFRLLMLGEIRFSKLSKLLNEFFKFQKNDFIEKVNMHIDLLKNNIFECETIFSVEEDLINYIEKNNYKKIFIAKSNFCLKNEDLIAFNNYLQSILNKKISIIDFKKSFPIEMDKNSLLIYLGDDLISRYFKNKVNLLQIKLDYKIDNEDLNFINEFEEEKKEYTIFSLKYKNNTEELSSYKRVLYYELNDRNIYIDTIKNIYENEFSNLYVLSDFSQIKEFAQKFIDNYNKNSQTRKKIKNNAIKKKYDGHKNYLWSSKKEYYNFLADKFLEQIDNKEKYKNLIINNLHHWIEKDNLPRDKYIFIKFLEFINLSNEANNLFYEHKCETLINQNSGKEIIKQIETIFEKDWENNIDYKNLIEDLINSGLFKKTNIELKGEGSE